METSTEEKEPALKARVFPLGELCCGPRDCFELAEADIKVTPTGYLIRSINETVPFHEATPSPNGKDWRCFWGGKRKCFFAPPGTI